MLHMLVNYIVSMGVRKLERAPRHRAIAWPADVAVAGPYAAHLAGRASPLAKRKRRCGPHDGQIHLLQGHGHVVDGLVVVQGQHRGRDLGPGQEEAILGHCAKAAEGTLGGVEPRGPRRGSR